MILEKEPESRPLWKCGAMPTKHAKVGGLSISALEQVSSLSPPSQECDGHQL